MALVARRQDIEIREFGTNNIAPHNPIARLMFYLFCMKTVMDLDPEREQRFKKLCDFQNWHLLNEDNITGLLLNCIAFVPEIFIGKCIFLNEEACGEKQNVFCEVSQASTNITVSDGVIISGQRTEVRKIMFYKKSFLVDFYYMPMLFFENEVNRLKRVMADIDRFITNGDVDSGTTSGNTFLPSRSTSSSARSSCCNIL